MKWLIALVVAAVALSRLAWRWRRGASRQRRLMLLCERAGVDFAPLDLFQDTAWLPFPMFGRARSGTENVVWDRKRGPDIRAFDFWYQDPAGERSFTPRRRFTCAVVPLAFSAPRFRVAPRDLADDVQSVLGLQEVRLELEEFNRRFVVETEDHRFAIAFLEQRMEEGLLALPDGVTADANENVLLLSAPELPAEQVLLLFDAAVAIQRRLPHVLPSLFPPRPARGPHEDRWLQGRWTPDPTEGIAT
jgi:hypothetical protein